MCTPCQENCTTCFQVTENETCVDRCSADFYEDPYQHCLPCHKECHGCSGPSAAECKSCRNFQIPYNNTDSEEMMNCTKICPKDFPYKHYPSPPLNPYCSASSWSPKDVWELKKSFLLYLPAILMLFVAAGLICCFKNKEKILKNLNSVAKKRSGNDIDLNNFN